MANLPVHQLRIGAIDNAPFTSGCSFDPVCPYRGTGVEMTILVCKLLSLNCSFTKFPSSVFGTVLENGTSTGMVGAVQRGDYDTSLPILTPSYIRMQAIDFSHAYYYAESILVTRGSTVQAESSWSVIYAFRWHVWCIFIISLGGTAAFITMFQHKEFLSMAVIKQQPLHFIAFLFEACVRLALVNEHRNSLFKHRSTMILSIFWGYSIVVLASAYGGLLFSQKMAAGTGAPFDDFDGFISCVESGKCVVVTPTVSISYILYLTAPASPQGPRFEKAFQKNPIRVIPKEDMAQAILDEQDVYLTWVTARNELPGFIDENTRCSYFMVPTPEVTVGAFPFKKGSTRLLEAFNLMSSITREVGLEYATGLETMDKPCSNALAAYESVQANNQRVNFDKYLKIPLFFYMAGLGFAGALFLLERRYRFDEIEHS